MGPGPNYAPDAEPSVAPLTDEVRRQLAEQRAKLIEQHTALSNEADQYARRAGDLEGAARHLVPLIEVIDKVIGEAPARSIAAVDQSTYSGTGGLVPIG